MTRKGKKKRKLTREEKIKKVKGVLNAIGEWARNVQTNVAVGSPEPRRATSHSRKKRKLKRIVYVYQ